MTDSFTILLLTLCSTITSIISGVIGMAGGITLLTVMTFFFPLNVLVPIHGIVQLVSNSGRTFFLRKNISYPLFLPFLLGVPFGAISAYLLIKKIDNKILFLIPIILIIFYTLFKPKKLPHIKLNKLGFFILGVIVSCLSPLMGATGPLLAPFFLGQGLKKEEIIATKSSTQTVTHLIKIPIYLNLNFPYSHHIWVTIFLSLGAIIGTQIGVKILGKVNETFFIYLYKSALFLAMTKLIYSLIV